LFQSKIITVVAGGSSAVSLFVIYKFTLINSTVALVGYWFMAFTMDAKWMGRVRMQSMGFSVCGLLFLICAADYNYLITPGAIAGFQAMYFLSSFWGQWGPNGTTWLLPVELFPTDCRPFTHGIAAAVGKLGALVVSLAFSYGAGGNAVDVQTIFYVNAGASIAGVIQTYLQIPNTMEVPLGEVDRQWQCKLDGKIYCGPAMAHKNLAIVERCFVPKERGEMTPEDKAQKEQLDAIKIGKLGSPMVDPV
jgi:hypothetical protein